MSTDSGPIVSQQCQWIISFYHSAETLPKLECSLNGWRSTIALTGTCLTLDIWQIEGNDSNFVFHFSENAISHWNQRAQPGAHSNVFFHKNWQLGEEICKLLHEGLVVLQVELGAKGLAKELGNLLEAALINIFNINNCVLVCKGLFIMMNQCSGPWVLLSVF